MGGILHPNHGRVTTTKLEASEEKLQIKPVAMGLLLLLHVLLITMALHGADGWGKEGHFMVCKIAEVQFRTPPSVLLCISHSRRTSDQKYFTEATLKAVSELLPESAGGELAKVCSWADQMRFRYHWSSPLHYIDTHGVCTYTESRDCHNSKGEKHMCVVGAINNYTDQLQSFGDSTNTYNLTESLMFLAHFVGDVHQPLHVGYEADEGGNTIIVHWYRRKTNLHHVWDDSIIETAMKDYYNNDLNTMLEAIQVNITEGWSDDVDSWEKCRNKRVTCANSYALESIHLACHYAYKDVEQNSTLGDEYFFSRLPIVEKRIAQAGVRLALILNRIFDKGSDVKILSYQKQAIYVEPI